MSEIKKIGSPLNIQVGVMRPFSWESHYIRYSGGDDVVKLNLGCGYNKQPGFVNIDSRDECSPDLVCDILKDGLPYKDEEVMLIYSAHFLEHFHHDAKAKMVDNELDRILDECRRVLNDDGYMVHVIPSPNSGMALRPFHKTCYSVMEWKGVFDVHGFSIVGAKGVGTWIQYEPVYSLLSHLAEHIPFLGREYMFILRKK